MSKEMLTTDIDTGLNVEEMFVCQKQAGEEVAIEGTNLIRLQQKYNMIPYNIRDSGYTQSDIDETTNKLASIKDWSK